MAEKHIQEVLTSTGLTADQFKALKELPDDAHDFKPETYTAPINTAAETRLKNDPKFYEGINKDSIPKEFLKTIESEQYGRAADQVRTKVLQAAGLSKEDFKDLGDEFKKLDIFTPAFVKKVTEGKVTDKELQAALMKANEEKQAIEATIPTLEKKYQDQASTTVANATVDLVSLSTLAQVQGLTASAQDLAPALLGKLRAKYDFKVDGLDVVLLQKGKTLRAMNEKGTKELTFTEAVQQIATDSKWITTKAATSTEKGTTTVTTDGNSGELKIAPHILAKQKALAERQKTAAS